jgi:hypothetical protein
MASTPNSTPKDVVLFNFFSGMKRASFSDVAARGELRENRHDNVPLAVS